MDDTEVGGLGEVCFALRRRNILITRRVLVTKLMRKVQYCDIVRPTTRTGLEFNWQPAYTCTGYKKVMETRRALRHQA